LPAAASGSVDAINAALGAGDLEEARKAAHVLKGFSSSLGAARIAAFAREIELEIETITAISERVPLLVVTIDATVEELSRMVAGA